MESIPNRELISEFSAIIYLSNCILEGLRRNSVVSTWYPASTYQDELCSNNKADSCQGKYSLVNYFVVFGIWVFQRHSVLVLIWLARWIVLQGRSSHTHYELFFFCIVAIKGRRPAPSSNYRFCKEVQLKQCRISIYCTVNVGNTKEKQQQQHSWHVYYSVYRETVQK